MRILPGTAAIAAALFAGACSKAKHPPQPAHGAPQAAAPGAPTQALSQSALAAQIATAGVTRERATQLFSMVVGPLPGVPTATGERDTTDFDGTLAVGYLWQVWDSLTPEQQRVAFQLIRGATPSDSNVRPISAGPGGGLLFRQVSFAATVVVDSPAFDYSALAHRADFVLGSELNVPQVTFVGTLQLGPPLGTEYADTWSFAPYQDGKCHITIWNQKFQGLDSIGALAIVTHEMFHCYQQRAAQTAAAWLTVSPWIQEGEPTWAMIAANPTVTGLFIENKWIPYIYGPKTIYRDRSYDAVGVFGHQSDLAGDNDVWGKLLPMVLAGEQRADATAFHLLVQGNETSYYSSWGASYFQVQVHTPWLMQGPGTPPTYGPNWDVITVDNGTAKILNPVPSDLAQLWKLDSHADILIVNLYTGYARLHDDGFAVDEQLTDVAALALCLKPEGCTCPDGSPGASDVTKKATAPITIGADGGDVIAQLGVVGKSLDDFCKKPDPQSPGVNGGGGGSPDGSNYTPELDRGKTAGDTHLVTFDGAFYNLQVKGELTLVRSTKDDFTVQVRQVAVPGSRTVAVNQAVATKLGSDTIMIAIEQGAAVLRINGKVVTGPLPRLKGGTITRSATISGDVYRLTWPDGTMVEADQSNQHMNVRVVPASSRRGSLIGLLGDDDGSPDNDLVGLKQARLGLNPSNDDVAHSLADAWRITQAQSLFTYKPGESTAAFTDRSFPDRAADPSAAANRARAEAYCKSVYVTDQHLLDDCVLDLAATNDFGFAREYAHAQQVMSAHLALAGPSAARSGAPRIVVMTGEILDSKAEPEFRFEGKEGDVIWIHGDSGCVDRVPDKHPVGFRLFDPTGKEVQGPGDMGCYFGRRELPMTGTYTFKAAFGYANEITRWRVPIHVLRPDRHFPLAYGQSVTDSIEVRAVRDIYTFSAQAGDTVRIAGPGCSEGGMLLTIYDPQGHEAETPNCRVDSRATLRQTGIYQLVINTFDGGPGQYHFVFQGGTVK